MVGAISMQVSRKWKGAALQCVQNSKAQFGHLRKRHNSTKGPGEEGACPGQVSANSCANIRHASRPAGVWNFHHGRATRTLNNGSFLAMLQEITEEHTCHETVNCFDSQSSVQTEAKKNKQQARYKQRTCSSKSRPTDEASAEL